MSRLIVKGLPIRYNDGDLRKLFSFHGQVTDAKVVKTKDGKSRQFGFVGFRTSQEAKSARHRLHKTYVDTSKVSVDFAHAVGNEAIPRPWSKYSAGSSMYENQNQVKDIELRKQFLQKEARRIERIRLLKEKENGSFNEKDKQSLAEFKETAQRRASNPLWADGGVSTSVRRTFVASRKNGGEGKVLEKKHLTFDPDESDDDALYDEVPNRPPTGDEVPGGSSGPEEGDSVALDDAVSDLNYFNTKVVKEPLLDVERTTSPVENEGIKANGQGAENESPDRIISTSVPNPEKSSEADNEGRVDGATTKETFDKLGPGQRPSNMHADESIDPAETGRLMVLNVAYAMTSDDFETAFEKYGTLADVHIVRDVKSGKSRGMGFVQFIINDDASKALAAMDGTVLSGRIIRVLPARPRPSSSLMLPAKANNTSIVGNSSYKTQKEEAQKESARKGLDIQSQHALHLSSNAVAEIAAQRHGASKADLFGASRGESGIAAVRLAMAEAVIQSEARQYLLDMGVDLEAAEKGNLEVEANTATARRKRQIRHAFLVKNLPARTKAADLREVFSRFGSVAKMIVIPSGLLAVVVYGAAADAKCAYNGLAYTRFRDTPLYLEWLPVDALKETESLSTKDGSALATTEEGARDDITHDADVVPEGPSEASQPRIGSVYVKNLNFDTRDAALKSHFVKKLRKRPEIAASLRSATVAIKRKKIDDAIERLSMGFGFLEFSSVEDAKEAIKLAQNTLLDGHTLELRLSNQVDSEQGSSLKRKRSVSKAAKPGPKLMVRNIAFEATKRDVRQLFSAFGQLKLVRLPQKIDGSHRGFAFVEFVSKNEAKSAFKSLSSTHLYGRRLVIEYAEEDIEGFGSIAALQEKSAAQVVKKRIRGNEGTVLETGDDGELQQGGDEQAMLEDALYG